jgi:hypothetical protein
MSVSPQQWRGIGLIAGLMAALTDASLIYRYAF